MKIVALDIGDVWTGSALSDALGMLARPYQTIATKELEPFLNQLFAQEKIGTVVVGHPTTLRGTASVQTTKVEQLKAQLEQLFPSYSWILWDERLTSQQAQTMKPAKTPEDKRKAHSIAAALILRSYLDYLHVKRHA